MPKLSPNNFLCQFMPVENFLSKNIKKQITSISAGQTKKFGEKLAKQILAKDNDNSAVVIGLQGELGAGKTTFLQGFARGLGIKEKITSPTFVLMKRFEIPQQDIKISRHNYRNFYHLDCYRIEQPSEILTLGWQEIINNPKNIIAIEWPDKIKPLLPKNIFWIKFKLTNKNKNERVIVAL